MYQNSCIATSGSLMAPSSLPASLPVRVNGVTIDGHAQRIRLRIYRPLASAQALPVVLYLHGGGFLRGDLDYADAAATAIATGTPAIVVAVGYSLSPRFPFPVPLEDGYLAGLWAVNNVRDFGGDAQRLGIAGHDAGGNLATGIAAMARDRKEFTLSAQALLAPLLDPSMTRLTDASRLHDIDLSASECALGYRSYLPNALQRLHPYAAPLESRRLARLPPTLIVSAAQDLCHGEGEAFARALIAAGVPTESVLYVDASHGSIATHPEALADVASFFHRRFGVPTSSGRPARRPPPYTRSSQE
jgi:acetyl esterase/lipase